MKKFVIISSRTQIIRRFRFALRLVNQKCHVVSSAKIALELDSNLFSAVFIDPCFKEMSANDLAEKLSKILNIPVAILELMPWDRKNFYQFLQDNRLISEPNDVEPFSAFPDSAQLRFLRSITASPIPVITPVYDDAFRYGYHYPEVENFFPADSRDSFAILAMLFGRGLLTRKLLDRIYLCPNCDCHSIHFREICPACKSIDFTPVEVVHHFLCGYVGEFEEFYKPDTQAMLCPKCNDILRHIGLDYEKPATTFKCNDCGITFQEPAVGCFCPKCASYVEPDNALQLEIYSYQLSEKGLNAIEKGVINDTVSLNSDEPFSAPLDLFKFMLRQNLVECAFVQSYLYLTIFAGLNFSEPQRREMLAYINEIKHPASLFTLDERNFVISQNVRIDRELLEKQLQQIYNFVCDRQAEIVIFCVPILPTANEDYGRLFKKVMHHFNAKMNQLESGVFFDEI